MARGLRISRWLRHFAGVRGLRRLGSEPAGEAAPLRAELFSAEQMQLHGKALAHSHGQAFLGIHDRLLERLDDNEKALLAACALVATAVKAENRITPAAEWMLDNAYLIEEQIRTARQHLPKGYSRELPLLAGGPSAGLPRVYDLALEVISHGDGRIDAETLGEFVAAYQTVIELTLGELWAIPIMLRLALIENLRRVGVRTGAARVHQELAQDWAGTMIAVAERDPKSLILVIADMARSCPPMVGPFVAELVRRLQGQGPALALPLTWIEQRLVESSQTIQSLVHLESQQQAADQVSISNSIGSLRFLGASDWRVFVEGQSCVERVLLGDPAAVYAVMDFATRDQYRHIIDGLAKCCPLTEIEVAQAAIELAQRSAKTFGADDHRAHVGHYLIDGGVPLLRLAVAARLSPLERMRQALRQYPRSLYLGSILLLTVGFAVVLMLHAQTGGLASWRLALLGAVALLAASQLASALVNWLVTLLVGPRRLPRMDYAGGIPPDMRTLVVIPTMILGPRNIDELLEALEVRFLGNREAELHFALLTDFADAPTETLPGDEPLLRRVRDGIVALNAKYPGANDNFLLLHRARRWNPGERVWMGHERKRGKLADLNAALRGHGLDRFTLIVGQLERLAPIRYVITLDTDTELPRDAARLLIGAMAHPLNRPRYDPVCRRVTGGYGILQPRMAAGIAGSERSRYAQLCGNEAGIDPYTRSVSDVYQDLFGEGSFIGKGIYDVDAFERVLAGRLPENRILSHDLLEGCYARSGLISDVQLYENHPATYAADVSRQERWIRGDWQIARWLLPHVPGLDGARQVNPLIPLSRGKILDNLRRSLVPVAMLLLLVLGWTLAPAAVLWTVAVLAVVWLPPLLSALVDLLRKPVDLPDTAHVANVLRAARHNYALVGFRLACLPHEAWINLQAIGRTCWRMLVSRRRLLEWRVAQSSAAPPASAGSLRRSYRMLWIAPVTALLALYLIGPRWSELATAAPLLCLWLAAPAIVAWLDQPMRRHAARVSAEQKQFLRKLARRTWAYFERFVTAEENWLPPDNYQVQPGPVIAQRTSPTNIGLALLSSLSARDFGFIGAASLLQRCSDTFTTLGKLERHRGHFYNWYDTRTLQPLAPRYVSAVDSGNLAGHLLTLRAALLALPNQPVFAVRWFTGLSDTLDVYAEAATDTALPAITHLRAAIDAAQGTPPETLAELAYCLDALVGSAEAVQSNPGAGAGSDLAYWAEAVLQQCRGARADLHGLAPWLALATAADASGEYADALDLPARLAPGGQFGVIPSLPQLAAFSAAMQAAIAVRMQVAMTPRELDWLSALRDAVELGSDRVAQRSALCRHLAEQANAFAIMEYAFLYEPTRHLLAVGYNVDHCRRDTSYYDLLASEARLGTFVAISQGQLPQESWFALGRLLTQAGGKPLLVSWSGSMFEYLMPQLVMPSYRGSLLDQSVRAAVARQIAYGNQRGLPWGVSESGYYTFDASLNYQYHAFGVPGLGLKRGLADDAVVAPYASALALMVAPEAACANLQRLAAIGMLGDFGLFEAIDYTPARQVRGNAGVIVRSYMAHHQGMSLLSLAWLLLDQPMQRRFESDPQFQASLLLLQERAPKNSVMLRRPSEHAEVSLLGDASTGSMRAPLGVYTRTPEVQLLSNGSYHVMVSNPAAAAAAGRTSTSPAGAKTAPAIIGAASSICAIWAAASSGRRRTSRPPNVPITTRPCSPRAAPNSAVAITRSTVIARSWCRRKTISSCVGCISATVRCACVPSRSPATARWCWHRQQPTRCNLASAICSCRPRSLKGVAPFCARAGRARAPMQPRGCSTCWPATARWSARPRSRPTACVSSAAGAALPHRKSCSTAARYRALPDRCSTRSSPFVARCGSILDRQSPWIWFPVPPPIARPAWRWSTSTRTAILPTVPSMSELPTPE
jgi:cyclic beta-1,2-glucan synthetase